MGQLDKQRALYVNGVEGETGVIAKDSVGTNEELEVHLLEALATAVTVMLLNPSALGAPVETKKSASN